MSNKLVVSCALAILCMSLIPASFLVKPVAASTGLYVVSYNPYAGVDWGTTYRLKTELHAHTILGGGGSQPYQVINNYAALGYDALGISDYNTLTWPWTTWWEFLSPAAKSMVPIQNDEVADHTGHFTAPFLTVSLNGTPYGSNIQGMIDAIIAANGIPIISAPVSMGFSLTTADSWTGFRGLEIYNPMDGTGLQPFTFQLWDHLLTDPARADKHIWGLAVDDSHDGDLNRGWIVIYAAQKTATSMKNSIITGSFVAVVNSTNSINNVTQVGNTLKVDATSSVIWKADSGQIVGTGSTLDLDALAPGYTYVRAEVGNGEVFTQPIFIRQTSPYTIFSNGFEDGLASWTGTIGSGYIDQSSETAHSGLYSAKVSLIHYYGDKAYANKSLGATFKRINIRTYVNFSSDSTTGIMMGPLTLSSSGGYVASVVRDFATSQWGIRARNPTSGNETYYWDGTSAIILKKWYYIELEAVMSVHGFAALWIDGALMLNVTNFNFGSNTISSVAVGEYETINDLSTNLKYYLDDVVVSDSYIGSITPKYALTVGVSGHGTTNATGTFLHDANTNVVVLATPDVGYHLGNWLRNATNVGSANPYTINMTVNYNLTAIFIQNEYTLTVTPSPPEGGYVTLNNTGPSYHYGDWVRLTAHANLGWSLTTWSGDASGSLSPVNVLINGNKSVTANFAHTGAILTVTVSGNGATNATGTHVYDRLTNVTVFAVPDSGWNLDHWVLNGTVHGATSSFTINMTADYELTAVFAPPSTYLVIRGVDNSIYYSGYNPTSKSWSSWNTLPYGSTLDSPASAIVDDQLYVVVRGVNYDEIWFSYVNLTDDSFSGWTLLSGATPSAPTLTSNSTTLCLIVRGESNIIWYRFYDITSGVWSDWANVPDGATYDTPAAALLGDTLQVVVRGVNNDEIWHCYINSTDNTFSGWTLLSGATPSVPTLTTNGTTLGLVVRGETNTIWYRFYDINTKVWGDWTALPDGATIDTPAASFTNNQLQIVVRGMNYDEVWHSYVNLSDSSFSGWTLLSKATPSKPTLTS